MGREVDVAEKVQRDAAGGLDIVELPSRLLWPTTYENSR